VSFTLVQKLRNKIRIKGDLDLSLAKNAKIVGCDIFVNGKNNQLIIEKNVKIRLTKIEIVGDNCCITVGENTTIGHNSYLSAKEGRTLSIGRDCMFSRNVKVMTSDGHFIYKNREILNKGKDIVIENNVWLADNVTILKGVHISSGSVVGIDATLTRNLPSNSIAAGNPAKIIQENIEFWEA